MSVWPIQRSTLARKEWIMTVTLTVMATAAASAATVIVLRCRERTRWLAIRLDMMSTTIMLGDGEPTGETPDNDALTPDVNENLTVDFGFWPPQFDLALRKQLQSGANTGVVAAGDPVTFTIRVLNQGNVAAADITVVDYIPVGLTLNDSDWTLDGSTASILPLLNLDRPQGGQP